MAQVSGMILIGNSFINGEITVENGIVKEISESRNKPDKKNIIISKPVNAHTHCADGAIKAVPGMSLEDLVAPPNGLKHKYLQNTSDEKLLASILSFSNMSKKHGSDNFIDFREGGIKGCQLLKKADPEAIILGRPISKEFDANEIDDILDLADGIGLPSISDMNHRYVENVADRVRKKRKIFAIHASERVREDIDEILSLDPTFVVHMTMSTDDDLLKCAEAEVKIVVCTRSNLFFGRVPPIKRMIDCGNDLAIGTDNAMLYEPDMFAEASVFANILSKQGGDPEDVWPILSRNGRKIIYNHDNVDINVGKPADFIVLPHDDNISADRVLRNIQKNDS